MKKLTFLKSLLLGGLLFTATSLFSQVNISGGNTVTQNFDGLGTSATATMPSGWKVDKNTTVRLVGSYSSASTATEKSDGNGMSTTAANGIYNYGAGVAASATDRAVGGISSSSASKSVNVYVQLTNNGSTSIDNFTINFDVEKYRKGTNAAGFSIQMYYSTDGTTWTSAGSDFIASFIGSDVDNTGYSSAPGATSSISNKTLSQSLAAGASLYLAWNYSVTSGTTTSNAQALGIDNVSITANTATSNPTITASPESLSGMTYVFGNGPSAEQSFQISGSNLTSDLTLTPSANIEISTGTGGSFVANSPITLTQSSGTVAATTIYVRLKAGLSAGTYNETITAASGSTTKTITAAGSVTLPTAAAPTFDPAAGTYTSAQDVTISSTTSGASIYYTTDGTDPNNTGNGTLYSSAISVTATTTLKAIAYATGYDASAVASATYTINTAPTITVTEVTVPNYTTTVGNTQAQTITVNATNLTADISVALSGTDAAQFSVSPATIPQTGGSVTNATVTVTYAPNAPGSHTATVELSSTGATTVTRSLTGTATLTAPVANNATGVSKTGFTANWNAVTGATSYNVNVYTKTGGTPMSETEGFDGITPDATGKLIQSATYVTGWSASSQSTTRQIYTTTGNYGVASPSFAFTTTGDYIQTNSYASPITSFSFWAKQQSGTTSSTLIEGYNGSSWVTIATLSNADVSTTTGETKTYDLSALGFNNITQIKMTFTKDAGNLSIDDVTVNYGGTTINPITGSPFSVSAPATTQSVTGLSNLNTYYYTVTAKNGTYSSPVSNETTVGLLSRVANPNEQLNLWSVGNKVYFRAAAGEAVELFNVAGQKIVSRIATDGINEITVSGKGILFVKAGSLTGKVLIH